MSGYGTAPENTKNRKPTIMTTLDDSIQVVHQRLEAARIRAERAQGSVRLLAVSKTRTADEVRLAHAAGLRAFGENYVQEGLDKIAALADLRADLEWHLIGPLQSNKTRAVAEGFDWVHSVDRLKTAERLSAQRPEGLAPLQEFGPEALRAWIHGLGIDTFVGTSGRVFPTEMKAARADQKCSARSVSAKTLRVNLSCVLYKI